MRKTAASKRETKSIVSRREVKWKDPKNPGATVR
jgi:hypothetical protein